jgi:hypothetical protein
MDPKDLIPIGSAVLGVLSGILSTLFVQRKDANTRQWDTITKAYESLQKANALQLSEMKAEIVGLKAEVVGLEARIEGLQYENLELRQRLLMLEPAARERWSFPGSPADVEIE